MDLLADKYITGLYQELEREVIADIARRVKKTGRFTETAELMAKSMKLQGYSPEQLRVDVMKFLRADKDYQREVAQNTKEYKAYVQGLIDETYRKARENGEEMFDEAANMAFNNDLSMWEEHGEDLSRPSSLSQLAAGAARQTNDQFRNLTRSTGFRNTRLGAVGIMNAYQKEMDLATLKVATGVFSYDQAVRDCVTRLAQSGLRSIDYGSGRSYQLDTAARMCIRTGFGQLTGKITEENLKSMGHDLVITSQHTGSRPEHAVWQNKVFSYSGKNKKYPDFVKATGYGTVTGLMGANCRHSFRAYWEGDYIPPDLEEPDPVTIDGKEYTYYQATQKQRLMERNIRATKREIEAMDSIGEDTAELRRKLKYQTKEYHRFSEAAGIRAKNDRLRVAAGTSNLNVTSKEINKAITLSDISAAAKNTGMTEDAVYEIQRVIERNHALGNFAGISFKELPVEKSNVIMETVTRQKANWSESSLIVNTSRLSGMNVQEIDDMFRKSSYTVCNSFEDGIIHEIYHAKLADRLQFSEYNRLCDTEGLYEISKVAKQDLSESIAEIGVLKERGVYEGLSDEARKLFENYFEV